MFKKFLNFFIFAYARIQNLPYFWFSRLINKGYHIIVPSATYAPWIHDKFFLKTFAEAKKNSLLNFYQAWELWQLAENTSGKEGNILEVGVWRGSSSIMMGTKLKQIGSNKKIFACDTFEGVVKAGTKEDNFYVGGEHKDTSLEFVKNHIENNFHLSNVQLLKGIFPDDTGHLVTNEKFCLVHIDVDAYISAKDIMTWVWDRLTIGGVVVFNDYGFPLTKGITLLVNEYLQRGDAVVVHNLNGNGIIVKIK
ncbi:MAG TPA: TylF/MycF/NovP-related O-methyltransferase [Chitinophagales bacterium]|nr:TylF/MycF family methyltransferase [Chitinophagales bacterium]MCB9074310.1 class I SAM-dependent methyltransferase [Chitinophagales bacterium]HMU98635.1 TylF/MycF/NovP-related O-methyltransferase [Chitinophagales bacterium]HMV02444.1 TylF/MycF/NovP-related O-methyltransferase [Chitinophagales bacterium]HMW93619.1 TylF/MycF/NovP-related O-methyltransferase [Chitinophagales bacterium]